jgi:hypothetical protein
VCVKFSVTTIRAGEIGDILNFRITGGTTVGPNMLRESDYEYTFNLTPTVGIANYTTNSVLYGAPPILWITFEYRTSGTPFAYEADISFVGFILTGFLPIGVDPFPPP